MIKMSMSVQDTVLVMGHRLLFPEVAGPRGFVAGGPYDTVMSSTAYLYRYKGAYTYTQIDIYIHTYILQYLIG